MTADKLTVTFSPDDQIDMVLGEMGELLRQTACQIYGKEAGVILVVSPHRNDLVKTVTNITEGSLQLLLDNLRSAPPTITKLNS